MKLVNKMILFLLIFGFSNVVFAQNQQKIDWTSIKVLISNRSGIEKNYGKGEEYGYSQLYRTSFGVILVDYKTAESCESSPTPTWDVPVGTVTGVSYKFKRGKQQPKLKELGISRKDYRVRPHGIDLPEYREYINEEKGIEIIFNYKTKKVSTIILSPSTKDEREHRCS